MYLQSDAAYSIVSQLGELGIVQFKDLKASVNVFQRQFVHEIRRCEEMERQLRFFEKELKKADLLDMDEGGNPDTPAARDMVDLEAVFESTESELRELNTNVETLERNYVELQELKYVLHYTDDFFQQSSGLPTTYTQGGAALRTQASQEMELGYYTGFDAAAEPGGLRLQLNYLAGVIPMARIQGFTRLLWFASRGNIYVRHYEIEEPLKDPTSGEDIPKAVFMAVFQGEQLQAKVKKISEGFRATIYPCLDSFEERAEMTRGVVQRMQDLQTVLSKSREQRDRTLRSISQKVHDWNLKVIKLKAVYHTMNMFHNEGQNFLCECWMPYKEMGTVKAVLEHASEMTGNPVTSLLHPIEAHVLPTYHKTNKFTAAFQAIIDAYGVACYKEVNPAGFSIITFPFLFSVMFGDFGHAILLLVCAMAMIIYERKIQPHAAKSEILGIFFGGRYMILLLGLFSLYSGLMYNDIFSKSMNIFQSKWHVNYTDEMIHSHKDLTLDPADENVYHRTPYEFGIDPVWALSMNKITFTNSFKKKISVIFGISQMLLGVFLSICNHIYFRKVANIICEFIPQLLFLLSIFGYLCAIIFAKWIRFENIPSHYSCSPNFLIDFINMFMMKYPDPPEGCPKFSYSGQQSLQTALVVIAVLSAIWMLLSKPVYLQILSKRSSAGSHRIVEEFDADGTHNPEADRRRSLLSDPTTDGEPDRRRSLMADDIIRMQETTTVDIPPMANGGSGSLHSFTKPIEEEEPFDAGEVYIHQAIHTIEFCLGCISHTASYLRLWALSLAHAQLSEVLWTMVMHSGFTLLKTKYVGAIPIFIVFAPFAVLTVVILLLMEGLSAFLHTLRLHWVEFNSKFYKGDGMQFEPLSFYTIINTRPE